MNSKSSLFITFAATALFMGALSAQADIKTGLVGWWPLADGPGSSIAADYSANGNTGTLTNFTDLTYNNMWTPTTDPSNMDAYALQFNTNGFPGNTSFGTNTYVIVQDSPTMDQPSANKAWTLSAWVYPTVAPSSEPADAGIICKGSPNGQAAYALYMSGGNFVTVIRNVTGSGGTTTTSTNALSIDTWYNVTAVIQTPKPSTNSEILVYLNGVGDSVTNANTYNTAWTTNSPVTIGCCMAANGKITNAFVGIIDQVRIYDRALAASDVYQLYTNNANEFPPVITQQPVSATVDQGATFTNSVWALSTSTLSYQWYTNGVGIAGATGTNLIINPVTPAWNGMSYYVVVSNPYGAVTSSVVQLTVETTIPTFVNQLPMTYTNLLGTNVFVLYSGANPAFSVSTLSATPVTYYWFTNGAPVGGVNASNFSLTNVQTGSFNSFCVASNSGGMTTSAVWSASVIADPANSTGGLAPYPQSVLALNPIGYWRLNDTNLDGVDNNNGDSGYICHDYVSGNDGIYTNIYLGQQGYNPATDPSDTSAEFGENADGGGDFGDQDANSIAGINFGSPAGTSAAFTVEAWVSGYQQGSDAGIVTLGYGGGEQFCLGTTTNSLSNTKQTFSFFIRDASGTAHTVSSSIVPAVIGQGPWYHLVGVVDEISNQDVAFYVNGALVGTASVTNKSGLLASSYLMSIGSRTSGLNTNYDYQFNGNINDVAVFNYAFSSNQVANEFASAGTEPPFFILPPPTNETLSAGGTLTIPLTAWGTGPLTNQWYDVNGNPIPTAYGTTNGNAINATLVYSNVPGIWNGRQVDLTVSNAYGSTNIAVTLTVLTEPILITNIPPQITLLQGQSYTYVVGAIGVQPIGYQWYGNGTGLTKQTNATYTLTASSSGTFNYYIIATNSLGAATSVVSTVTVLPPPTSAYTTNMLNLNPVGYWPMHEVETPAQGDIETNYGSLGILADGYYLDWATLQGIDHGFPGALANDPDTAVYFPWSGGSNAGATTNCLVIPVTSSNAVLNPPFSVECWFYPTNGNQGDVWGQAGYEGLNAGGSSGGAGDVCGIRLYWGSGFSIYTYDNTNSLNGPGSTSGDPAGSWYHLVVTCDANTNITFYVNGTAKFTTNYTGLYSPDYWDPITIATGRGYSRNIAGAIDEFAVYPTNLLATDIQTHYTDGTGGALGIYVSDVTNDHPVIYLRMDSPSYTPPPASEWPVLVNYGSVGVNGVYTPGTVPGVLQGLFHSNGEPINGLSGTNVAALSGVSSFADAGYAPAYNPVGPNAFSVAALFRGNPCDGRLQDIAGHSDNSWGIAMNSNGHLQCHMGTNGIVNSMGLYNDGNWHQVVDVYRPASSPTVTGTNMLYVDGLLDTNVTGISTNGVGPGTNSDVMIASDPEYTNNAPGLGRNFAGQVCEVALFTNALTAAQVGTLYSAAGDVPPYIIQQPSSSYVGLGSNATAVATAAGTSLTYQWYETNLTAMTGYSLAGQTNATLVISNIASSDDYYLELNNAYGTTNSMVIAVTVYSSPIIVSALPLTYTNVFTLYAGANPSYSVSALGLGTLSYYWRTNGVAVGGATGTNLTLASVQAGFLTNCCIVSNSLGWTSNLWVASVIPVPAAPYPQSVMALNPIGYWRLNDTNLDGVDNNNGDSGYICHDYVSGNDGIYTNVYLGQQGYNPATDPSDTSAEFGENADGGGDFGDQDANSIAGINFGSPAGTSAAFTVEAWVSGYPGTTNSDGGIVTIGWGNGGEQFNLDVFDDVFRFFFRDASGAVHGVTSTVEPAIIGQGPWYHLAAVVDEVTNQSMTFYINGQPVGSTSVATGSGVLSSSYLMSIGARMSGQNTNDNDQFLGYINDVAIFNYALSAPQIVSEYSTGGGTLAPYFSPVPATNAAGNANSTLTIPVTALGTPPINYWWTNVTTTAAIAAGATNSSPVLNAGLNYPNVPPGWNGDQLELTVSNAYGMTNAFVTLSIANISTTRTNIVFAVTNNQLTLSWPANHIGWTLQAQTNNLSVGIGTNWVNVSNSVTTNQVVVPINLTNGSVFYRLQY